MESNRPPKITLTDPTVRKIRTASNKLHRTFERNVVEIGPIPEAERFWLRGEAEGLEKVAHQFRHLAENGKPDPDSWPFTSE